MTAPSPPYDYETAGRDRHDNLRLWLRLLTSTRLIENAIRSRLRVDFAVTLPRFDLMAQLDRVAGGLSMSDLSARLMVSNGNVTGIVAGLRREGLVEQQAAKTDRRTNVVRLTRKGRAAFRQMATRHERWIDTMFDDLTPAQVAGLLELLSRVKASVRRAIGARLVQ